MVSPQDRAAAKFRFGSKTSARRTMAAFLADYMYTEPDDGSDPEMRVDELVTEMGILPTALTLPQRERIIEAVEYLTGKLDTLAGRPKAE